MKKRISYLAPVVVYPGQDEMLALTENAVAALEGKQEIKVTKLRGARWALFVEQTMGFVETLLVVSMVHRSAEAIL